MSSLFRSQDMSYIELFIPSETLSIRSVVGQLGELGQVQFTDLNEGVNPFQRTFVSEIRRCDEVQKMIELLRKAAGKIGVDSRKVAQKTEIRDLDQLEENVRRVTERINKMQASHENLKKRYLEYTEQRYVLRETATFFEEAESRRIDYLKTFSGEEEPLLMNQQTTDMELGHFPSITFKSTQGFVAGVISSEKLEPLHRILWRALRGNLFMKTAKIEEAIIDPTSDAILEKYVILIYAHGDELLRKVRRICEALGGTVFKIEENPERRREAALEVISRVEELNTALATTYNARKAELTGVAKHLQPWLIFVLKEKAMYETLNRFKMDASSKFIIAEGWIPATSAKDVELAISSAKNMTVPAIMSVREPGDDRKPPTSNKTNKYTVGFQRIVDAYGIATYKEVNPALFSIITFPFLFAVMFGDFGHGVLLTLSAIALISMERGKKPTDEMVGMAYSGRYIMVLMGIFSMFTGLVYNDIFSKSQSILPSGWSYPSFTPGQTSVTATQVGVFAFGVDSAWDSAENGLIYSNSYKMKMSVIFGVTQMTFGLILSFFNHVYHKHYIGVFCEVIPQILFLMAIFGYLCFTIIFKWVQSPSYWSSLNPPPGLLNMLIYMFLTPGSIQAGSFLYHGQEYVQSACVLLALVCVPWMLFSKPIILWSRHKSDWRVRLAVAEQQNFDFSGVFIGQAIHTIEFCLGCISNTASYLRLWALSLAHSQLSQVLWSMVFEMSLTMGLTPAPSVPYYQPFVIFAMFMPWFFLSVGVLLCMEGMSAFLHALRLHWVEFNNKFYEGEGVEFQPFTFSKIIKTAEKED